MSNITLRSEELLALGTRGISTEAIESLLTADASGYDIFRTCPRCVEEAIESLLTEISEAQDRVALGNAAEWQVLENLRQYWAEKLMKLQAYLAT